MALNGVSGFLEEVKRVSRSVCGDRLVSIRQFGSIADGQYRHGISDIDFIVLVRDDCPREVADHLRRELVRLETEHNVAGLREMGALQRAIASHTALFKSHFVFHQSTLEKQLADQLFEEAEALDLSGGSTLQRFVRFLFPWRLVLANVLSQSRLILGWDGVDIRPLVPWRVESARAFVVAFAMSLLGLIDSLLSKDGTRLSLEATKWYLIDQGSSLKRTRASLSDSLEIFRSSGSTLFLDRFAELRNEYSSDRLFSISCPLYLLYLQFLSSGRRASTL